MPPGAIGGRINERRAASAGIVACVCGMCGQAHRIERRDRPVDTPADRRRIEKTARVRDDSELAEQSESGTLAMPARVEVLPIGVVLAVSLVVQVRTTGEVFAWSAVDTRSPVFLVSNAAVEEKFGGRCACGSVGQDGRIRTQCSGSDRAQKWIVVEFDRLTQCRVERPIGRKRRRNAQAYRDR